MTKQQEIDLLRSALSWLDPQFVDRSTSYNDLWSRIDLMRADVRLIDERKKSKVRA